MSTTERALPPTETFISLPGLARLACPALVARVYVCAGVLFQWWCSAAATIASETAGRRLGSSVLIRRHVALLSAEK